MCSDSPSILLAQYEAKHPFAVWAAPLDIVRKTAIPPSAPQATPGKILVGILHSQSLTRSRRTFRDGSTVARMCNPCGTHRTASCSLPSVNVRPHCMCCFVCACWPWMITPLWTALVPFRVDTCVPCCIHTDWKNKISDLQKSMSSSGACRLPARSRELVTSVPVPTFRLT